MSTLETPEGAKRDKKRMIMPHKGQGSTCSRSRSSAAGKCLHRLVRRTYAALMEKKVRVQLVAGMTHGASTSMLAPTTLQRPAVEGSVEAVLG